MALSNMINEPRREITESLVGLSIIGLLIYGDYRAADYIATNYPSGHSHGDDLFFAMFFIFIVTIFGSLFSLLILWLAHELGDFICDQLDKTGLHLRPKQRRVRNLR